MEKNLKMRGGALMPRNMQMINSTRKPQTMVGHIKPYLIKCDNIDHTKFKIDAITLALSHRDETENLNNFVECQKN